MTVAADTRMTGLRSAPSRTAEEREFLRSRERVRVVVTTCPPEDRDDPARAKSNARLVRLRRSDKAGYGTYAIRMDTVAGLITGRARIDIYNSSRIVFARFVRADAPAPCPSGSALTHRVPRPQPSHR